MNKLAKTTILTLIILFFSCEKDNTQLIPDPVLETPEELKIRAINKINELGLKFKSTTKSESRLSNKTLVSKINFKRIKEKLESSSDLDNKKLSKILGEDYDEALFKNIQLYASVISDISNSNTVKKIESIENKKIFVEDILMNVLNSVQLYGVTHFNRYKTARRSRDTYLSADPCEEKANESHKLRLKTVGATTVGLFAWAWLGGVTAIPGSITFVIGTISSGLQYDIDMDYCNKMRIQNLNHVE